MDLKDKKDLSKLFWRYLWSSILISVSSTVGTIVDGAIVGNLIGESGVSAINLSAPMVQLMFTLSFVLAAGAGMIIGYAIGEKNMSRVRYVYTLSMGGSLAVGLLFSIGGLFFSDTISGMLCNNESLFPYTRDYLRIILIGSPTFMILWAMSTLIGVDGSPRLASVALVVDNVVNLMLDVIFIRVFDWGIAGASTATIVGHLVGIVIMLYHFYGKENHLYFSLKHKQPEWGNIISQGAPLAIASIGLTLLLLSANHIFLSTQGERGIFIFAICMNLLQIYNLFLAGTCRTLQSLGAIQIGKEDKDAFQLILRKSLIFITVSMIMICSLICLFPKAISEFFGATDLTILTECNHVLRIFAISFIPFCYIYLIMIVYKLYKQDTMSLFISFALSLTVIPVLWIVSHYALEYVWYSYLIAYVLEIAVIYLLHKVTHAKLSL